MSIFEENDMNMQYIHTEEQQCLPLVACISSAHYYITFTWYFYMQTALCLLSHKGGQGLF